MPGRLRWNSHASFAQGMVQDVPRHLLPDDAVWDADNVIVKRSGALARRGGVKSHQTAGYTIKPYSVVTYRSYSIDATSIGYVLGSYTGTGGIASFVLGSSASALSFPGLPAGISTYADWCQHGNFLIVATDATASFGSSSSGNPYILTGRTLGTAVDPTGTGVITAGSPVITGFTDVSSSVVGDVVYTTSGANLYYGRVVKVDSVNKKLFVEPTPTFSEAAASISHAVTIDVSLPGATTDTYSGFNRCASFQNRLVVANVVKLSATGPAVYTSFPNRLMWSPLPTETVTIGGDACDGLFKALGFNAYPLNYVDLPNLSVIEKIVPIGQGQLLILGSTGVSLLVGNLETITATAGGVAFSIQQVSTSIGCLSFKTVQTTPAGVMWASREGVMLFDGSRIQNVMADKIARLWRDTYATATMYGSAVMGTHYLISTSAGGLLYNMLTGAWTKFSGVDIAASAVDPTDANRVYAVRANADAAVSNSNVLFRLDTILDPSSSVTQDYGTTTHVATIKTKTYTEGDPHNLNRFRHTGVVATVKGTGATMSVASTPGLEAEETGSTLGTISASATGPQRVRYDHQIISPAIGYTLTTAGAASEAELLEIRTATNQLRPGRTT